MEVKMDVKGRVVIPRFIRDKLGIDEGTLLSVEERSGTILLKAKRKKKTRIKDLFGQKVERTGEPEWATPEEIKSIWE